MITYFQKEGKKYYFKYGEKLHSVFSHIWKSTATGLRARNVKQNKTKTKKTQKNQKTKTKYQQPHKETSLTK